jgi:hypothetical protein
MASPLVLVRAGDDDVYAALVTVLATTPPGAEFSLQYLIDDTPLLVLCRQRPVVIATGLRSGFPESVPDDQPGLCMVHVVVLTPESNELDQSWLASPRPGWMVAQLHLETRTAPPHDTRHEPSLELFHRMCRGPTEKAARPVFADPYRGVVVWDPLRLASQGRVPGAGQALLDAAGVPAARVVLSAFDTPYQTRYEMQGSDRVKLEVPPLPPANPRVVYCGPVVVQPEGSNAVRFCEPEGPLLLVYPVKRRKGTRVDVRLWQPTASGDWLSNTLPLAADLAGWLAAAAWLLDPDAPEQTLTQQRYVALLREQRVDLLSADSPRYTDLIEVLTTFADRLFPGGTLPLGNFTERDPFCVVAFPRTAPFLSQDSVEFTRTETGIDRQTAMLGLLQLFLHLCFRRADEIDVDASTIRCTFRR